MRKILVCDLIDREGVKRLEDAGFVVEERHGISQEELGEVLGEYDALVVRSATKVSEDILEKPGRLKAIARAGVGLDNIALDKTREKNIKVFNSPEAPSNAVAEHVLGLIFAMARGITRADSGMKEGKWEKNKLTGVEIAGKTVGIIGLGRVGQLTAEKLGALGAKVVYWSRSRKQDLEDEPGLQWRELKDLFAESDFISIHVPLSPETKHIISFREFELMKDGVHLVNAARGGVVDEDALKEALASGKVAGAALDVFEKEPDPDMELVKNPKVIATPHIGAGTREAQVANSTIVADKLIKFFK